MLRPVRDHRRNNGRRYDPINLWSLIALSGGFLLYQGAIVLIHPAVVDGHAMGAEVVGRLLRQQFIWGGGLALAHGLWLQRRHAISTFDQFPREGNEQDG